MAARSLEDFTLVRLLKQSVLCSLWLATREGMPYSLKVYRKRELVEHCLSGKVKKEAMIMKSLDCPFICKL
jgi:hypothetical protein